jgi:hypothetical protein
MYPFLEYWSLALRPPSPYYIQLTIIDTTVTATNLTAASGGGSYTGNSTYLVNYVKICLYLPKEGGLGITY